jgi:hypothetical protein
VLYSENQKKRRQWTTRAKYFSDLTARVVHPCR